MALAQRGDHGVLVREVLVERSDAHAGDLGDAVRGRLLEALGLQNVSGRDEDRVDGLPCALLARLFPLRDGDFTSHWPSSTNASRGDACLP